MAAVRGLTQGLSSAREFDVRVIGLEDEDTDRDRHLWGEIPMKTFPTIGPRNFGYAPGLARYLQELPLDLVHTHGIWMYTSSAAHRWAARSGRPYMVTPHGMLDTWALKNSTWKKRMAGLAFENSHLQHAACLHALCPSEARAIRAYGLRNPICVIPNGIDLPEVRSQKPGVRNQESPWEDVIEPGRKVLLYLGRIHPKKGLVNLLKAWAKVQKSAVRGQKSGEWVLAIAGWDQGGHEAELKKLTSDLDLLTSVHFIGPQFDGAKAECYANCDAFILPSLSEGLPMVVLEAWAYGKPVLMTPECNLPEGFAAHAAIRIEPNVESVADGLEELFRLSSAGLCSLGTNGRTMVAARFTWPRIASNMKRVYEWVLGGGCPPECVKGRVNEDEQTLILSESHEG
jgi:poly(glycerol-phosphate) alpha-glucosyltransferase